MLMLIKEPLYDRLNSDGLALQPFVSAGLIHDVYF